MRLTRIRLEDFRCFGVADFDLTDPADGGPLDVVLLVGGNGSGKSAVLDALAGFFTHQLGRYATNNDYGGKAFSTADIRQGAVTSKVEVSWRDSAGPEETGFTASIRIGRHGLQFESTDAPAVGRWIDELQKGRSPTGLIVSSDVYRLLPPSTVVGPTKGEVIEDRLELALAPTLDDEGRVRPRAQHLKQWIVNLDARRARAKADRGEDLPLWHTLRHALNVLLAPYTFEGVDDSFQVRFQTPTGKVPIEALSDGFRSVFVVVAELLLRLSLATSSAEQVLEQEAVALVDEIDAHLHPRWQENVIPGLRALFPRVQWIATTHSESVVSAVEPKNVFRLEDGKAITATRQDARFRVPERRVVSIDQEVFEGRPGAADRRWLLDPPVETRERFWKDFGAMVEPHEAVFVAEGPVLLEALRDVHERSLKGLSGHAGEAALFFVDRQPDANWAHPCLYVVFPVEGEPLLLEHIWPPSEAIHLLPLARPPTP